MMPWQLNGIKNKELPANNSIESIENMPLRCATIAVAEFTITLYNDTIISTPKTI